MTKYKILIQQIFTISKIKTNAKLGENVCNIIIAQGVTINTKTTLNVEGKSHKKNEQKL